jgi:hypothetical protein
VAETRFDRTAWGAASSNHIISTIQSFKTAHFQTDSKRAISGGIFAGIVPLFRSLVTLAVSQADFSLPSLHPKIPSPQQGFDGQYRLAVREYCEPWEAKKAVSSRV